jgi:peptidoglycan/xylan/chitin deacetylase (PgdA/CDA1 family)
MNQEQLSDLKASIRKNEIEIALHGFNHNDNELHKGSFLINPVKSEFTGLEYNNQFEIINKAKKTIDSLLNINSNIFIPPFNTYDDNTLKVLDSLKFEIISASIDGSSISNKMRYIPFTLNNLNELHKVIKKYQNDNTTIVVLMHPYSFKGGSNYSGDYSKPIDFRQLDNLLNWIKNQNYINTTTFSMLNQNEIFDSKRFVLNSLDHNLLIKALNKMEIYRYGVYNTAEYEIRHKGILTLFNLLFHILTFVIIYGTTKIITKMIKPSKKITALFFAFLTIVLFLFIYSKINSYSLITLSVFSITIFVALLSGTIRANNTRKVLL